MSGVLARALTMVAVVIQSFFNYEPTKEMEAGRAEFHLAGLVLARGGSKGIPRKNLVEINGHRLVGRVLNVMIESGAFTSIWVSTDDEEISSWVMNNFKNVHIHNRAAYTATDEAKSISGVVEFLGFHPEIDAIGLVQATSPFVKAKYLREAASLLSQNNHERYDSIFSVTRSHQLRWSVVKSKMEYTKPINFNPRSRPRRQDWEGEMVENGMFYFVTRQIAMNYQVFQSQRSGYIEIPKHLSLEVDTKEDLEIARCLALKFDEGTDAKQPHQEL